VAAKNGQENLRLLVMEMLLEQGVYSHMIVRDVLNKYNYLPQQEKAFIKRLYEGTIERQIELDYVLNQYAKVKVNKMKPVIRAIMRMSAYQILYMDSVPDAAACNEAVKLAQKKGFATLKGFVNGVLRNVARNKDNLAYTSLSIKYSMPEWIVDLWRAQLGAEKTELVLKTLLKEHPVTIRIRNIEEEVGICQEALTDKIGEELQKQGGTMELHSYLPYAYKLYKTDDITMLPFYGQGGFVVQDISSMLAVEALNVKELLAGKQQNVIKVVDVCAAPGGKSMLLRDIFEREGVERYHIIARDVSEQKRRIMEENFQRCGGQENGNSIQIWDALDLDETLVGQADIVIADVPCSGLGVIGKKRDIKYHMTPEAIADIIRLQEGILINAAAYLKPGGRMLFSTCTINCDENEKHYEWLKNELKLTPVSLNNALPECLHSDTTPQGYLQLLPGVHDSDGFFISVFTKKIDIKSLSLPELKAEMEKLGEKTFRAVQLYEWIHKKLARSYDEMTNISKSLKEKLLAQYEYISLHEVVVQTSKIDGTKKYLFELADGNFVESVWMQYHHGNSVCISSQVGCRMGCRFCASTLDGLARNLAPSEMLDQIYAIEKSTGERVSNVVVMGTGEPLDNYDNLKKFIQLITDENGLHISQRNITVSTCGIVENIKKLADEKLQITLALSLHGATQEKRQELMPIAKKYALEEVLDACCYYYGQTGRRITFEYSLISGVNDTDSDAEELCALIKNISSHGVLCHINLIPVNPVKERDFRESGQKDILNFQKKLEKNHINVTIRREMGRDIDGACGQLRRKALKSANRNEQ